MRRFFIGLAVFALAAPVPLWAETTDRQIAKQIVEQLKSQKESGQLKGFNLDLQVEDGAVFLKGFVANREQRRRAVEAAQRAEGVKQVFNEIEIKSSGSDEPSSRPRTAASEPAASKSEPSTTLAKPPVPPQVAVDQNDASAEEDREISGLLQAVVTEAQASPTTPEDDGVPVNKFRSPAAAGELTAANHEVPAAPTAREITEAIVAQYRSAMEQGALKGFGIEVHVNQGVVSLAGTVADQGQLDYAIDVASNVAGVTKVVNALDIRPRAESSWPAENQQVASDEAGAAEETQVAEAEAASAGETEVLAQEADQAVELAEDSNRLATIDQPAFAHEGQQASHDEPAESSAGVDAGVQHAFRQQSNPRGIAADSERIAKEVVAGLQRLKYEGALVNFGIDVRVDGRDVWLSGYVRDADQHQQALDVARYVRGVETVVNDLSVQDQQSQLRPVAATLPQQNLPPQMAGGMQPANYQLVPIQYMPVQAMQAASQTPLAFAPAQPVNHTTMQPGQPVPMVGNAGVGIAPARFDQPQLPGYAWPSYAPSPNYGAVTYPKQYSPSAWPYIGPFYPYPQVPLGWRRVTLEWDDGWWNLKFKNTGMH